MNKCPHYSIRTFGEPPTNYGEFSRVCEWCAECGSVRTKSIRRMAFGTLKTITKSNWDKPSYLKQTHSIAKAKGAQ